MTVICPSPPAVFVFFFSGDIEGYDLCSFFNLDPTSGFPSWGENSNPKPFKGTMFCCPNGISKSMKSKKLKILINDS